MKKVVVVGLGAIGSHLVFFARNWDVSLVCVDFDTVQQKNTWAQMHTRMSLRKNKAVALKQAIVGMFGKNVLPVSSRLGDANVVTLFEGADLVIDCTDNIETRMTIRNTCRGGGIPCLHSCLSADGTFSRIVWAEDFEPDAEGDEGEATCEDGEQLPFFAKVGAQTAEIAQQFLTDGRKVGVHLSTFSLMRLR